MLGAVTARKHANTHDRIAERPARCAYPPRLLPHVCSCCLDILHGPVTAHEVVGYFINLKAMIAALTPRPTQVSQSISITYLT